MPQITAFSLKVLRQKSHNPRVAARHGCVSAGIVAGFHDNETNGIVALGLW
jgi:hypothetical protein